MRKRSHCQSFAGENQVKQVKYHPKRGLSGYLFLFNFKVYRSNRKQVILPFPEDLISYFYSNWFDCFG